MKWEMPKGEPLAFQVAEGKTENLPLLAHIGDPLFGFLVYEGRRERYYVELVVTQTVGVTESDPPTVEQEQYLKCSIKRDGCSHFWFGYGEEGGEPADGYLHICGKRDFDAHCELMQALFALASQRMGRELDEDVK